MDPLPLELLNQIETRCAAASPAPWVSYVEGRDHFSGSDVIVTGDVDIEISGLSAEDQDFVAHARQDVPMLLAEIYRLRQLLKFHGISDV